MKILLNLATSRGKKSGWLRSSRTLGVAIKAILDTQVKLNQLYLRQHHVPPLYESDVVYKEEPDDGLEEFAGIEATLARGWGDCDDLAPWRAAELREQGENAKVRVVWKRPQVWSPKRNQYIKGRKLFHIVVRRGDGTIEDPSRILGMK